MLPVSTKRRIPFTPAWREAEEPKPVYHLRIPTTDDRTEFNCALGERRARVVFRAEFMAEARKAIAEIEPPNTAAIMALIERVAAVAEPAPLSDADAAAIGEVEDVLAEVWPPYARLLSANTRWNAFMPTLAARMFLVGWQNGPDGTDRVAGSLDEDARMAIPQADLVAIGLKCFEMLTLTGAQRKNSPAPSPVPSTRTNSPESTASAARDGSSPASATPETPA